MALLATQAITVAGLASTLSPATASTGDTFKPSADFIVVNNGGGAPITATVTVPGNLVTGDAYPDKAYTIGAGAKTYIPVLREYRNPSTGLCTVVCSSVTSVTVGAFSV